MDAEFSFEIGAQPPVDDARFEKFWTEFSRESAANRAEKSAERDSFRSTVLDTHRAGFEAMELLHESAEEAINWASDAVHDTLEDNAEDDAFAEYFNVLVGLGGRALLAFDEVAWLIRGGYPRGAWTRVRSLQELFVAAATLGLYGSPGGNHPDLVRRYVRHHEVFAPALINDLIATEIASVSETLNDDVLHSVKQKRQDLIDTYGKDFARSWGWAAPLLPRNPTFAALSKLVLPGFNALYGIASSHLHASSQGLIEAAREGKTGERYFLAGAAKEDLKVPAALGSGFLIGTLGAIVPTSITYPGNEAEPNVNGHYFLNAMVRIREQILKGMSQEE